MGWDVEYHDFHGRKLKSLSDTRESALRHACELILQGSTVHEVLGRNGQVVAPDVVERDCRKRLAAGQLT